MKNATLNADRQASKLIAGDNNPPGSTQMCEVTLTALCGRPKAAAFIMDVSIIAESIAAAVAAATPPTGPFPQGLTVNLRTGSGSTGPIQIFGVIKVCVPVEVGQDGKAEVDQAALLKALLSFSKGNIQLR